MATDPAPQPDPGTSAPPSRHMTFEEFLDWMDEDTYAEWVAGEVVMASPASTEHQRLQLFLSRLLATYVEWKALGEVLPSPYQVRLPNTSREPDVLFVAAAHAERLRHGYLDGPADLVVEIVSPESIDRDYRIKYAEYEAAGIPEYWLIDPDAHRVLVYALGPDARYRLVAPRDGRLYSTVLPDFWLDPVWLWQDPLPRVQRTLFTIGGDAYKRFAQAEFE